MDIGSIDVNSCNKQLKIIPFKSIADALSVYTFERGFNWYITPDIFLFLVEQIAFLF